MYAISLEQSYATEILARLAPCWFRFWQTDHRGLPLIHARTPRFAKEPSMSYPASRVNALVGVVELINCITSTRRDDADEVEYHWLLGNPLTFAQPLPYGGRLGLFLVSERVVATALEQVGISRWPQEG